MGYDEPCFSQSDEDMIRDLIDPKVNPLFEGITYEGLKRNGWARAAVDRRGAGASTAAVADAVGQDRNLFRGAGEARRGPPAGAFGRAGGLRERGAKKQFPLQVISAATHYFIGASFQHVPRLQEMLARPTFEVSGEDAKARNIEDGDYCRLFNDRGEVFGHALIVDGLLPA